MRTPAWIGHNPGDDRRVGSHLERRSYIKISDCLYFGMACQATIPVMTTIYRGARLRQGRHSEEGRIYHVTTVTNGRYPFFF